MKVDMGFGEGRIVRFEVVVKVSREDRDGGRMAARWLRSSFVVVAAGRVKETVGGSESPGKVLRRTLTFAGNSMVVNVSVLYVIVSVCSV
jgi:hypothetical protein